MISVATVSTNACSSSANWYGSCVLRVQAMFANVARMNVALVLTLGCSEVAKLRCE